jgi:hypothetical protein
MKEFITDTVANTIKSLSKKTLLITILLSLISSASTYWLVKAMEGFKMEIRTSGDEVQKLKVQIQFIVSDYIEKKQQWDEKDRVQKKQVAKTDSLLSASKIKQSKEQSKVEAFIQDTSQCNETCDSTKENLRSYVDATQERDSLCDNEVVQLKEIIQTKDSALNDCNESFLMMQQAADSSVATAGKLAEQLKLADKSLRRNNIKSKFLSSAVLVLSGATAILLLGK